MNITLGELSKFIKIVPTFYSIDVSERVFIEKAPI